MANVPLLDPLARTVWLYDSAWFGHIIKGHPEMQNHRGTTESAVTSPISIHFSTSDPDCRVYYGTGPRSGILTAVVADVVQGFVKTAYLTRKTKGTQEWP